MRNYMRRIVQAGPLVVETIYPRVERKDSCRVRQAKRSATTVAKAAANLKQTKLKLELMVAQNFKAGDYVITFTYDNKHLPRCREQVSRNLRYFRKKLQTLRNKDGYYKDDCLKMIWVIEHQCTSGRWHVHAILNKLDCKDDLDEIKKCWIYGFVHSSKLRIDENRNYETLALYIAKELRDNPGERIWSHTKNLAAPEVEYQRLGESERPLAPPAGALILHNYSNENFFCYIKVMKYILPGGWTKTCKYSVSKSCEVFNLNPI